MSNKLLINSIPIQVLPELAEQIGLNEAIFLQQLHYWLNSDCAKFRDEKFWIYNSYKIWKKDNFTFWSEKTIQRIVKSLRNKNLIYTTDEYNDFKPDNKLWYTINYDELREYEVKSNELREMRMKEKEKEKSVRDERKIKRKIFEIKKDFEASKIEHGQNDQTKKASKIEHGQNDQTAWTTCPDDMDNLSRPITENTTETTSKITYHNNRKEKNVNNKSEKNMVVEKPHQKNNEIKTIIVEEHEKVNTNHINKIAELQKKFKTVTGEKATLQYITSIINENGYKNLNIVLDKFNSIRPTGRVKSVHGFVRSATKAESKGNGYKKNKALKAMEQQKEHYKPVQSTNFDQREYDNEFFDSLYDNFK